MATKSFTILYKNTGLNGKLTDPNVYTFNVDAKDEKDAVAKFHATRVYSVEVRDMRFKKAFVTRPESHVKSYTIVRVSTGDPMTFVNYRGKVERKYVRTLPSRMPSHIKKSF